MNAALIAAVAGIVTAAAALTALAVREAGHVLTVAGPSPIDPQHGPLRRGDVELWCMDITAPDSDARIIAEAEQGGAL